MSSATEGPGSRIGPYRLVEELGAGGMGVVWLAEQLEPVRREVALKIVRVHPDDTQGTARFEAERQALALMDHPNIAKVLGAGRTDGGRPYFAMELVRGLPITEFCDKHRLPVRERLALFAQVCHGVAHAHQKGIIHRDLKPSNVMVALYDDRPVPKVIDFGLAKAMGPRLTEKTLHTLRGQLVGTLPYMSPEQAELDQSELNIDTRSDIYSLGVLLYELLTGTRPLELTAETPVTDFLQAIRTKEPPKPSTRLSASGDPASIAEHQRVEPQRLSGMLRGDLDWIVMKALEKERHRRYETAHAFAEDIRRYMEHEPVLASPPTALYRLRKFARRRPALAGMVALGSIAIVLLALLAGWHAVSVEAKNREIAAERDTARAARDEEGRQRALAERLAEQVLERKRAGDRLVSYVVGMNGAQRAWDLLRPQVTLRLLDDLRPESFDGIDHRGWEWHYLKRLCHSEELLLRGHAARVLCVAYSPDGALLGTGSRDGTARLWSAKTGETVHVLRGHLAQVACIAFSADGRTLATGGDDGDVRLWGVASGREEGVLTGHVLGVRAVAFDPKGRWVVTAGGDDTIQVHELDSRQRVRVVQGHEDVRCLAYSPDGALLASAGASGGEQTVQLRDTSSWTVLRVFEGNSNYLGFTPDGKRLVYGGIRDLRVAEVATGAVLRSIAPGRRPTQVASLPNVQAASTTGRSETSLVQISRGFQHAALSRDGARVCTADRGFVEVWDAETGMRIRDVGQGDIAAWSPDGVHVATAIGDGFVRILSTARDPEGASLAGHRAPVTSLAFSPDGRWLASGSRDQEIRLWDGTTGEECVTLGEHLYDFAPSAPGQPGVLTAIRPVRGHAGQITSVAFRADGRWVASASQDGTLRAWETATGRETLAVRFPFVVTSVAWAPDGETLAAGSWDDDIHLFEFPGGRLVRKLAGHEENVSAIAFLEGGKLLASAGWDQTVRIFDVTTGEQVRELRSDHLRNLTSLDVSPDGSLLAVAGQDMVITVWATATWDAPALLWGHSSVIDDLAFSPDGKRLASAGRNPDDGVRIWDVATGSGLLGLYGARSVAFSPDGKRLAVGTRSADVRVYDMSPIDGQPYRTGRVQAPGPEEIASEGDGKPRLLGFFSVPALRGNYGAPRVVRPSQDGSEFLVAVISLPRARFVPSEAAYARMVEEAAKPGADPLAKRECISVYNSRRFRLLVEGGERREGVLVSEWPPSEPGLAYSLHMESSDRIPLHERVALAVAWPVDPGQLSSPMRIALDEDEPLPLPQVRLAPDPRFVPPAKELVHERIRRAADTVQTGKYADAAAEAAAASDDKDADADAVYNAACVHALAAARARREGALPEAEHLAARAVALLRRAAAKGFRDVAHMGKDTDLDELRQRGDFAQLMEELAK